MDTALAHNLTVGLLLVVSFCSGYLFKGWLLGSVQKTYPIYEKIEGETPWYKGHVTICGSSMESVLMSFVAVVMTGGKLKEADEDKRI